MAFDVKKNKRLGTTDGTTDGIDEVEGSESDNSNETTIGLVESARRSNVLATQKWVSRLLRRICAWTQVFHTNVLHAVCEVATKILRAKQIEADEVHATTIYLTNKDGGFVKICVNENGKLDIEETVADVFVYPDECFVREYLYRTSDVVENFAGLTPYQTLLNFVPFIGCKKVEHEGQICYLLCTADGSDDFIGRTLLFNLPAGKTVRAAKVVDANGTTVKEISVPEGTNQLTVNLPRFERTDGEFAGRKYEVEIPAPTSTWAVPGDDSPIMPFPPPVNCTGFVPPAADGSIPVPPLPIGGDIFDDSPESTTATGSAIDPEGTYEVLNEEYETDTYFNIVLRHNDFTNTTQQQFLVLELTP